MMVSSLTFAWDNFNTSGTPYDNCTAVWLAAVGAAVPGTLAAGLVAAVVESCAAMAIAESASAVTAASARSGLREILYDINLVFHFRLNLRSNGVGRQDDAHCSDVRQSLG